jgi:hypothetical protein
MKKSYAINMLDKTVAEWGSIADLLGPPAVLPGEDVARFEQLQARVLAAIKPQDAIEEILARDIVDLAWEIARRLKAALLRACAHAGAGSLAQGWVQGGVDAKVKVMRRLAAANLTIDAVTAETLTIKLDQMERFEALIASGEARLAATLREIDRHRSVWAELLQAAADVVEAEFSPIAQARLPAGAA